MRISYTIFMLERKGLTLITMYVVLDTRLKCMVRIHRSSLDLDFTSLSSMSSKLFSSTGKHLYWAHELGTLTRHIKVRSLLDL